MTIIHPATLLFFLTAMAIMFAALIAHTKLNIHLKIRRVDQLDQIDQMIKSTAERGRPILITPGGLTAADTYAPSWAAMFQYIAEQAGKLNIRVYSTYYLADGLAFLGDRIREGYIRSGHPELYRPEDQLFISGNYTWTQGTIGLAQRIQPGAAFVIGSWDNACHVNVMKALSLNPEKPLMMGGCGWYDGTAYCGVMCDYSWIGDQHMAAYAMLSGDPTHPTLVAALDFVKLMFIAIPFITFTAAILGVNLLPLF
jgi:hypothetical protein